MNTLLYKPIERRRNAAPHVAPTVAYCFVTTLRRATTGSNTEESFSVPARTVHLKVINRSGEILRIDFATGRVAATTSTIPATLTVAPFAEKDLGHVNMTADTTLYYASNLKGAEFDVEIHQE